MIAVQSVKIKIVKVQFSYNHYDNVPCLSLESVMTTIRLKRLAENAMAWMMVMQLRNDANVKVYMQLSDAR